MKRFLLLFLFLGISLVIFAQKQQTKGDFQIGAQGGVSLPVGEFKTFGDTKMGYYSGLFVDKYFKGNKFGVGLDARYIFNAINRVDSFYFENGIIETAYHSSLRFQEYLFTVGPTYKYSKNKMHVEAYARGGIMMRYFPEYVRSITYKDVTKETNAPLKYTTNDATNKANAWAGVAGLRFNYNVNNRLAVFAHADFVQSFGMKFAGKTSLFYTEEYLPIESNPVTEQTFVTNHADHFGEQLLIKGIHHQTVNAGLGLKYVFGNRVPEEKPVVKEVMKYDEVAKPIAKSKDLQIVVKDKQTNLSLSGVTVSVEGQDRLEKSITDANGQASKVIAIPPGNYTIYGEKNGIKTPLISLTEADFKSNSTTVFRELFHDDPRFTLVGETFDCNLERNLPSINTVLTNATSKVSTNQTSDVEGKFIYQLEPKSEYTVMANQQGRYSQTELVTTKGLDRSQTLYVTLKLGVCDLVKDDTWVLKNILYDFDKSEIRADAALILDNVVGVMKSNPSLHIELSSHTDSRGNDNYNMKLSQRRADAAVAYLVSKGISKSRLVAKGYGETRLVNKCGNNVDCTEEEHQENRRTEIKILDYTN